MITNFLGWNARVHAYECTIGVGTLCTYTSNPFSMTKEQCNQRVPSSVYPTLSVWVNISLNWCALIVNLRNIDWVEQSCVYSNAQTFCAWLTITKIYLRLSCFYFIFTFAIIYYLATYVLVSISFCYIFAIYECLFWELRNENFSDYSNRFSNYYKSTFHFCNNEVTIEHTTINFAMHFDQTKKHIVCFFSCFITRKMFFR